jgi:PAS domain S-box-containing protein
MEAAEYTNVIETQKTAKEQSDNKYQSFLDLAPNAVFLANAETGVIAEVNEQAAAMTGYSTAELKEMLILDLHPSEDEQRYRKLFESKPNDTSREWFDNGDRLFIRRKDGTDIPVEMSFKAVDLGGEPFIQGIVRDVSDRRDRIQRLERSREFIQQTQEAVDIGGWEYDLESEDLRWTDEIYRIFDLELDADLSAEESFDFFHPDDRSTIKHAFGRLTENGESFDLELRIITAEGTERWVRSIGRPRYDETGEELVAVLGVFRDITERKERQRNLRLRSEAIEESTVGITIADADQPDEPIIYANQGFTELTGYSKDYLVGKNCRFLQGEGTDPATIDNIREAIDAEEPIRVEILNYRSDGTPFWNKLTIAPVTGLDDEEVTHYVGIQDDITAQKRRERLIQILNRVLRHNLRNDMNKVGGVANMIAAETDGEVAEMATQIADTADELTRLSEKAQEFESAVADSDELAPRDITADVEAVVSELRQECPGVSFTIESEGSPEVMATERIRLALHELGENAAKHGDGSAVTYRIAGSEDEGVEIDVIDNGPGLPSQEQQVLFAGRETPLAHGSGLGLWLVNWVVSGLGGEVTATVDGGTTVTMTFPERNIESSESNMAGWNAALSTEQ